LCLIGKMNWTLELAKLEFKLQHKENLPVIATSALEEGQNTPSLCILAGLDGNEDNPDIELYLGRTLDELRILRPGREESAWILIEHYIDQIVKRQMDPHDALHSMIWYVYHAMDWDEQNEAYAGDSIGIEELYGLCDTFDDLDAALDPLSPIKSNEELQEELKEQIVEAAERYKTSHLAQRVVPTDRLRSR
jgi:hypothetical protein